jgi:Cysteine-rich secretory protein family
MRAWVLLLALSLTAGGAGATDVERSRDWEARMLDQINAERAERDLPPFRPDRRLERAAADHSRRMAAAGRLAHRLRGEPELRDRVAATGLRFDAVGENVGYSTRVDQLHRGLMRSRNHRANLLSPKYDTIGIAIYRSGDRHYVTQDFARATSVASEPEAERAFADAVAELRRRRRLPAVPVSPTRALREAACAMARRDQLDASRVPAAPEQRRVLVLTTFEPGELARSAREAATDPDAKRISIGVCHRESRSYPYGVYWFAVAY